VLGTAAGHHLRMLLHPAPAALLQGGPQTCRKASFSDAAGAHGCQDSCSCLEKHASSRARDRVHLLYVAVEKASWGSYGLQRHVSE
jgi:hypothetical protein